MTAFTVATNTNFDALTAGSTVAALDTYTISAGAVLTVRTDTYACPNHSVAFGSLDTVSYAGIGGELRFDPTYVRVVAYTDGSGVSPAYGAAISQGGVTGVFLGAWANWQSEPIVPGVAIPATGFIKIGGKTGGNFSSGALTGVIATASGDDVQSWIEVRGPDIGTITVPRIGKVTSVEAYYELGLTTGVSGQILPCPTTATFAGVWSGCWIETAPASGIYERYVGAGSIVALATIPTDERGKIIWQTVAGLRIGNDGVNAVGFLPPAGCRVRIPATILTNCTRNATTGSGPRVLPNATIATRQEFVTTGAGFFDLRGVASQWYMNFSQAFLCKIKGCVISDSLIQSEIASALDTDDFIIGPTQAQVFTALNFSSNFAGGFVKNGRVARFNLSTSGGYVNSILFNKGVTFDNVTSQTLLNRTQATSGCWTGTQNVDCTWNNCTDIGGRNLHNTAQRPKITNPKYADNFSGTTTATNSHYAQELASGCADSVVSGMSFMGLANVQPNSGLVQSSACYNTKVRNIGAYAAPLNMGTVNGAGVIYNGAGNNDGIALQKIYVANTRLGPYAFVNSDNNVLIADVKADYADTSPIAALNCIAKATALLGQTNGQISVYGTHWRDSFRSATTGAVEVLCNEPTAASAAQCFISSGLPKFNSSGQVALTVVGEQVEWQMPYFARGHTALANLAITTTGINLGNMSYEFQCDTGAGYGGTWLALSAVNLTAQGAINPATGCRLKVRATCTISNAGNLLTNIAIPTVTDAAAQGANPYPLDVVTLTLTGLQTGSDVVILQAGTTNILLAVDANVTTQYRYVYETAQNVDIGIIKPGFVPLYIRNYPLTTANASLPIAQNADRNFQ
jgi:hypothetical protein